jgi:protein-tyrosine phosphatase
MERLAILARTQLRQLTAIWPMLTMHLAMGVLFLCIAVLFAALTGYFGGITWLLVWPAFSLIVVGLGYVWLGPWVLGKQEDGTLLWYMTLPLMPYLGVAELAWYIVRVLGGEEPWHEVAHGLYLGRRVEHWELPARVAIVVDMTAEFVEPLEVREGRKYVCVPTLDASVPSVNALADGLTDVLRSSGNVYVHCAAGHGRSAMAIAVLMVGRGFAADADEAFRMMKNVRSRVSPRTTQRHIANETIAELRRRGVISAGAPSTSI